MLACYSSPGGVSLDIFALAIYPSTRAILETSGGFLQDYFPRLVIDWDLGA